MCARPNVNVSKFIASVLCLCGAKMIVLLVNNLLPLVSLSAKSEEFLVNWFAI